MAFTKSLTTRGVEASYLRLVAFRWDCMAREASAHFALFVDHAHSERCKRGEDQPLLPSAAKLRLIGEDFDAYLGPDALAQSAEHAHTDIVAHLYAAAKAVSQAARKQPDTPAATHVVSDFGADLFADAKAA